jgi:hypothetical protein
MAVREHLGQTEAKSMMRFCCCSKLSVMDIKLMSIISVLSTSLGLGRALPL